MAQHVWMDRERHLGGRAEPAHDSRAIGSPTAGGFFSQDKECGGVDAPRAPFVVSCAPMDREQLAEQLRQAEHHIAEATALIERQRERVREFAEAGHDTEIAETALRALESNLRAFERHRDSVLSWMKSSEDAPPSENG